MRKPEAAPKVFGAGLIALDMVISPDPEAPVRSYAGGTCGNVLAILSYLGWRAYPIARLGDDPASQRVRYDLQRWDVLLDYASCQPLADTPIIVQEIRRGRDGRPTHRFSWACPNCGHWLPGFKPVTRACVSDVSHHLSGAAVFFMDRLSRATLILAAHARREGAIVMFEPSGKADERFTEEALRLAHIVKYAHNRVHQLTDASSGVVLEVQTLGAEGLRYRHRSKGKLSRWRRLLAMPASKLVDTCGSGDWCSAGLLWSLGAGGAACLGAAERDEVEAALQYGQALAAWNCGFESARGGMYVCDRATLTRHIVGLMKGETDWTELEEATSPTHDAPPCPACDPNTRQPPKTSSTRREVLLSAEDRH
jgi:sugar/nucleoside kinase (ribokinase family)